MNKETKVKCGVDSCFHNHDKCCCLEVLDIGCTCKGCECHDKDDTICRSFKQK